MPMPHMPLFFASTNEEGLAIALNHLKTDLEVPRSMPAVTEHTAL